MYIAKLSLSQLTLQPPILPSLESITSSGVPDEAHRSSEAMIDVGLEAEQCMEDLVPLHRGAKVLFHVPAIALVRLSTYR